MLVPPISLFQQIPQVMDGITEPVVLVLGHPIAGNPAQFALERAFRSMKLHWRVLSCDVAPDQLDEAISGANILGFRGLLLDRNLCRRSAETPDRADLYLRAEEGRGWRSEHVLTTWLASEIRSQLDARGEGLGLLLSIGAIDPCLPAGLAEKQIQSPIAWASADSIRQADLIALSESVDISEWPRCEDDTLVVDFANPQNDVDAMRELGYHVIGWPEMRVGILATSFSRWTGCAAVVDDLNEAIEEYLAV